MRRMISLITVLMMSQAAATAEPQQIDLDVPSTTVAATVQINVKPSKGAVLLYTGPSYDKPIRFPGPSSTRVVPTSSRTVRIELVEGAKSFRVKILGRIDGLDGSKIELGSPDRGLALRPPLLFPCASRQHRASAAHAQWRPVGVLRSRGRGLAHRPGPDG